MQLSRRKVINLTLKINHIYYDKGNIRGHIFIKGIPVMKVPEKMGFWTRIELDIYVTYILFKIVHGKRFTQQKVLKSTSGLDINKYFERRSNRS